jgi:amidase
MAGDHADPPRPIGRRRFLGIGGAAAAGLAAASTAAAVPLARDPQPDPTGRASGAVPARPEAFELDELTLAQLREGLASGRWTARRLTELYLGRIDALDRRGPALHAMITVNPDALAIADRLDEERRARGARGPLHGIPILVKDNIDTADRMATTAGSLALAKSVAPRDAFLVERLRAAGAVLLGKTNLSEWANFRSTRSSSGWSAVGGQCRNPYVLDRNPCGSSSGSGAAVSANYAAVSVGTETDGSIVCPANSCGLVGLKPTVGLVSRAGIVPISHTQDTAGPMARTVADAAALLGALAGVDPRDPATEAGAGHAHQDYTQFLDPGALRGARIGVLRKSFGIHPRSDALMEDAIETMRKAGAAIVDPVEFAGHGKLSDPEFVVLLYEFKAGLNAYLAGRPDLPVRTLAELIAFNERHADREMPFFGQEIFHMAEAKGPLTDKEYLEALETCRVLSRDQGIDAALGQHRLDALIAPTGGPAWTTDLVNGDHFTGGSSTAPAVAGYPNLTVPAGFISGLPVGISFIGGAWSEPRLISLAFAFEQATHRRRPPGFSAVVRFEL